MGSPKAAATDNSATVISDDGGRTIDSDSDIGNSKSEAVDSSPPPPADSRTFDEGEKVLAFHGQLLYEAKIEKLELDRKAWRYFVHYCGWSRYWDEWVGIDRLMKYTKENVQIEEELKRKLDIEKSVKSGGSSQHRARGFSVTRGRKRKNDVVQKGKTGAPPEKAGSIQIPHTLKKQLIDDFEFITHLSKVITSAGCHDLLLVKLPRSPNVDEILNKYHEYLVKKDGKLTDSVKEILDGLRSYFDKALPVMLLYKNERQQYQEALADHVCPSSVYGAEHLLRLFVKLPEILRDANIEEETLLELQKILLDFIRFLQKNQSAFFLSAY